MYGYNGGLASPRTTLSEALRRKRPVFVVLYVNDSRDCKRQAYEITRLQSRFGPQIDFIAFNVDAFPEEGTDLMPYYRGELPHMLLFSPTGRVVYEATGFTSEPTMRPHFLRLTATLPRSQPPPSLLEPIPGAPSSP